MFAAKVIFFKILIMKKSILNFGKALNKAEQQIIKGGDRPILVTGPLRRGQEEKVVNSSYCIIGGFGTDWF